MSAEDLEAFLQNNETFFPGLRSDAAQNSLPSFKATPVCVCSASEQLCLHRASPCTSKNPLFHFMIVL